MFPTRFELDIELCVNFIVKKEQMFPTTTAHPSHNNNWWLSEKKRELDVIYATIPKKLWIIIHPTYMSLKREIIPSFHKYNNNDIGRKWM